MSSDTNTEPTTYYYFSADEWSTPLGKYAERPEPLSCHCFVKFDARRAMLFGGRCKKGGRNDTWIFDLEERVCNCMHNVHSHLG